MDDTDKRLAEMQESLVKAQATLADRKRAVDAKREELRDSELELQFATDGVIGVRREIHRLEGLKKNCKHHFRVEPSERGVGFDSVCIKCKWPENFEPSY